MSTAQVESVLVEHQKVAEAAVVAAPHKVKGECLYCFVTPIEGATVDAKVVAELKQLIREKIAPFAMPDYVQVSTCEWYSMYSEVQNKRPGQNSRPGWKRDKKINSCPGPNKCPG